MHLSSHFTLQELVFSQTAARRGIDNTPSGQVIDNLRELCSVLELVRAELGNRPLIVTSGYRSPPLNAAVGGSARSAHMYGLAVDFIVPSFGSPLEVARAISDSGIVYDQLIHEFGRWVHLGLVQGERDARREELSIFAGSPIRPGLHAA